MALKKKPAIERSGECYRPSWKRSFWWIFLWTLLFSPFWLAAAHIPACGLEHQMSELGMPNYNEFFFGSGQILAMAGLPLGLLTSELLSRRGCGSWAVGLSGIAVAFLSLIGGTVMTVHAFYIAQQ